MAQQDSHRHGRRQQLPRYALRPRLRVRRPRMVLGLVRLGQSSFSLPLSLLLVPDRISLSLVDARLRRRRRLQSPSSSPAETTCTSRLRSIFSCPSLARLMEPNPCSSAQPPVQDPFRLGYSSRRTVVDDTRPVATQRMESAGGGRRAQSSARQPARGCSPEDGRQGGEEAPARRSKLNRARPADGRRSRRQLVTDARSTCVRTQQSCGSRLRQRPSLRGRDGRTQAFG